jgi:nitrogen fixation NifU-like protein
VSRSSGSCADKGDRSNPRQGKPKHTIPISTFARHGSQVVNPLYGIRCTVYLDMGDGLVRDIGSEGSGCAILLASASLMTLAVNGKTVEGARAVGERFMALVTASSPPDGDGIGDLAALAGVRDYPGRVKCATLPCHALRSALEGSCQAGVCLCAETIRAGRGTSFPRSNYQSKSSWEKGGQAAYHTPCCLLFVEFLSQSFPLGVSSHLAGGGKNS